MRLEIEVDVYLTTKQESEIEKCEGDQRKLRDLAETILFDQPDLQVQGVEVIPS